LRIRLGWLLARGFRDRLRLGRLGLAHMLSKGLKVPLIFVLAIFMFWRNRQGFLLRLDRLQLDLPVDFLRPKINSDHELLTIIRWRAGARSDRGDLPQFSNRLDSRPSWRAGIVDDPAEHVGAADEQVRGLLLRSLAAANPVLLRRPDGALEGIMRSELPPFVIAEIVLLPQLLFGDDPFNESNAVSRESTVPRRNRLRPRGREGRRLRWLGR
jgi:hypothetical protein